MKYLKPTNILSCLAASMLATSSVYAEATDVMASAPAKTTSKTSLWQNILNAPKSIKAGHRFLLVHLLDDTHGQPFENSFIGSINRLEADQQYLLLRPYIETIFKQAPFNWGAGLSYDYLEVKTLDNGSGDGDVQTKIIIAYLKGTYPNSTHFTPFCELGCAFLFNDFAPSAAWSSGGLRSFDLNDTGALHLAGGVDYAFSDNIELNLYLRYLDADVSGIYTYRGDDRPPTPFSFALEHLAYGVGISYVF